MSKKNKKMNENDMPTASPLGMGPGTNVGETADVGGINLSTTGKIFFAAVASYLSGKTGAGNFLKLKGSPEELRAISEVLVASKSLQDELKNPNSNIDKIINLMNTKSQAAATFKRITSFTWPL